MKVYKNFELYTSTNPDIFNLFELDNKDIEKFIKRLKETNGDIDSAFYSNNTLGFSFMSLEGKVHSLKFSKEEWDNYKTKE